MLLCVCVVGVGVVVFGVVGVSVVVFGVVAFGVFCLVLVQAL